MKKLINTPDSLLADALRGVAAAHPDLVVDAENRVVHVESVPEGHVALISGGGSGHEPMHSGFVGSGMLAAACAGEIFTSPTPDQMLAAATAVNSGAGVLFIVKNYTGDVLNFEMAAELAQEEGIEVASVVIADDVAVEDSTWTAGRRGVARPSSWRRSPGPPPPRVARSRTCTRSRSGSRGRGVRWVRR